MRCHSVCAVNVVLILRRTVAAVGLMAAPTQPVLRTALPPPFQPLALQQHYGNPAVKKTCFLQPYLYKIAAIHSAYTHAVRSIKLSDFSIAVRVLVDWRAVNAAAGNSLSRVLTLFSHLHTAFSFQRA